MAPQSQKTNFKTYESCARLLAAVIATTGCRLDFKALAQHMGGDNTPSAIDHRLRPIKQLAKAQASYVQAGRDPGELPLDGREIQKLFGESTAAGLEFQFRDIKKLGKAQKEAAERGEDTSTVSLASIQGTPGGRAKTAATPGSRKKNAGAAGTPTTATKRADSSRKRQVDLMEEDEEGDEDSDYEKKDLTPPPPSKKKRAAAAGTTATPGAAASGGGVPASGSKPVARTLFTNTPSHNKNVRNDDDLEEIDADEFSAKPIKTEMYGGGGDGLYGQQSFGSGGPAAMSFDSYDLPYDPDEA